VGPRSFGATFQSEASKAISIQTNFRTSRLKFVEVYRESEKKKKKPGILAHKNKSSKQTIQPSPAALPPTNTSQ
jgi:hypothetical protein